MSADEPATFSSALTQEQIDVITGTITDALLGLADRGLINSSSAQEFLARVLFAHGGAAILNRLDIETGDAECRLVDAFADECIVRAAGGAA